MERPETGNRNQRINKIRSTIKVMPIITSNRDALESKVEKRRKRRQSIVMNPNDLNALDQDKKSQQELEQFHKKQKFLQKYELLEKIGQGSHGIVRKCRHKQKNKIYAVKCMELNEEHCLFLKKNFRYIKALDHPNIINYKALYLDLHIRSCHLVMDYETMPSLQKVDDLTQQEMRGIMKQLFETLAYIHGKNICHRDIKPDNILYDRETKNIKIIDFGISKKIVERNQKNQFLTITGTLYYRAPQIFLGAGYDQGVDIWAAGVTLYRLVMGKTPFESEYISNTIQNISKNKPDFSDAIWDFYSNFIRDLINRLLVKNRKERLTACEAQKHFWFSDKLASSYEGMLTHSDSFQFKLKRMIIHKKRQTNQKKEEPILKSSEVPGSKENLQVIKNKMKKWIADSDDEDILIQINSQGQQVRTPKTGKSSTLKKQQQTPSTVNQ